MFLVIFLGRTWSCDQVYLSNTHEWPEFNAKVVKDEQPMVQKFAAGALHNISRAVQHLAESAVESGSPRKQLASSQLMGDMQLDQDAEQERNGPSRLPPLYPPLLLAARLPPFACHL